MSTKSAATEVTLDRLLQAARAPYSSQHRAKGRVCPGCDQDIMSTAVVELAYVLDPCDCGEPEWVHLVEQCWHRRCFVNPLRSAESHGVAAGEDTRT